MSTETTEQTSDQLAEALKSDTLSLTEIINLIIDDSLPISPWLKNVIETYLTNTQKTEPLTINKLFTLTNDMLLTYSIVTSQTESKQLCIKLLQLLQENKHLPPFDEPFPVNSTCVAFYNEDNQWYPASIVDIIEPGSSYLIEFDGYGNQQNTTIDQLKINKSETKKSISLKDSIKTSTQKDKDLKKMIMTDVSYNCVKKKKYENEMMELSPVDEERLARLAMNDTDEKNFQMFIDAKEKDDQFGDGLDKSDAEKYSFIDSYGKKRRINPQKDICCVCQRELPLTWHHLIPKCTHSAYLKVHSDSTRLWLNKHGIWICRQCHSAIHGTYTNKELMKLYWKLEMLLESEKIQKWINYVSKQKVTGHYDRRANKKNIIAQMQSDKTDHSTKIKYIK